MSIRYAIYDTEGGGYVGHRTSCYSYSRNLPEHMINHNLPLVDDTRARLFLRKQDAVSLIRSLNKENRFVLKEFQCQPINS